MLPGMSNTTSINPSGSAAGVPTASDSSRCERSRCVRTCGSPDDDASALEGGSLPDWERDAVRVRLGEKLALLQQLERAATSLKTMN